MSNHKKNSYKWEIVTRTINGEVIQFIQTIVSGGHIYMQRVDSGKDFAEFFENSREIDEKVATRLTCDVPPENEILVSNQVLDTRG